MNIEQLWDYLLTPSGIILSVVITLVLVGIYAYLKGQFKE